jgi:GntR family transcriptional regulator, trigonelline degradation regulator
MPAPADVAAAATPDLWPAFAGAFQPRASTGTWSQVLPEHAANTDSTSLRMQIVQALRHAISIGMLRPGEQLSEVKLCRDMRVSRPSIREALRYLESEKLISIQRNRRPAVSRLNRSQAATIYRLLGILTGDAMFVLAASIRRGDLLLLRACHAQLHLASASSEPQGRVVSIGGFYHLILRCCENAIHAEMIQTLLARVGICAPGRLASRQG